MSLWIKICGVTSIEDALLVQQSGADAIGLNFARSSPRFLPVDAAARIVEALSGQLEIVGVFVDSPRSEILRVVGLAGLHTVQLHGSETPEFLEELQREIPAYKALRIGDAADVDLAREFSGERILTDAKVTGAMGGTGHTFDWSLISDLNAKRKLILAGGLRPDNVGDSIRTVRPYGVDTASGVEDSPGKKSSRKVTEFIEAARRADSRG